MRLKKKGNISTKEVTENLDAKLLDLRNKSVSLSGVSVEKCQPTNIKPLTGTLSSSKVDIESVIEKAQSTSMQIETDTEDKK